MIPKLPFQFLPKNGSCYFDSICVDIINPFREYCHCATLSFTVYGGQILCHLFMCVLISFSGDYGIQWINFLVPFRQEIYSLNSTGAQTQSILRGWPLFYHRLVPQFLSFLKKIFLRVFVLLVIKFS